MRTYGQYCPIARASEILAERWTPIIIRNLLMGCDTFSALAAGLPGIPKALLSTRLKQLEDAGILETTPNPSRRGYFYHLSDAGRDLGDLLEQLLEQRAGEEVVGLGQHAGKPRVVLLDLAHRRVDLGADVLALGQGQQVVEARLGREVEDAFCVVGGGLIQPAAAANTRPSPKSNEAVPR